MARKQTSSTNVYLPPVPKIQILNQGNWQTVENGISKLPKAIREGYEIGANKFSNKLLRIVRKAISSHTPPPGSGVYWAPLSDRRKKKNSVKGGIYYLQGEYYRNVGIYKYRGRVLVGMPANQRHHSGLTLTQLAIILEYGNRKIPARPLWRPAIKSAGGTKELKVILMKEIRRKISSVTGLKANQIRSI